MEGERERERRDEGGRDGAREEMEGGRKREGGRKGMGRERHRERGQY